MYQHFPFQCPPKFSQIKIFDLKINHPATLFPMAKSSTVKEPYLKPRPSTFECKATTPALW
jgi:hypothetical protein